MVLSRMDEESLRKIAADTGGTYVRSVAGDLDLDVLYFDGIKPRTTAQTLKSGKIRIEEERFFFFLLPALFFLLLIEGFLAERKTFRPTVLLVRCCSWRSLAGADRARAAEDPDQLYRKGRFAEAEKAYADLDMDHPKDVRYRYDRGCAAYQQGRLSGGDRGVLQRERQGRRRRHAVQSHLQPRERRFPEGGFRGGRGSVSATRCATTRRAQDARHNLELALRKREQQKQDQEKKDKQEQQDKKDQKDQRQADRARRATGPAEGQARREKRRSDDKNQGQDRKSGKPAPRRSRTSSGELKPLNELPENKQQQDDAAELPPPPRTGGWRRRC